MFKKWVFAFRKRKKDNHTLNIEIWNKCVQVQSLVKYTAIQFTQRESGKPSLQSQLQL